MVYRTTAHWAHPIRRAIEGNPILAKRDEGLEKQTIEVGEILKTRTGFCDECCRSEKNLLDGLVVVERKGSAAVQVIADRASDVSAAKFLIQFFEVVVEKHDDSRQVRSARFDRERTVRERAYCNRTIGEPESYDVLARSTGESAEISSTSARCFLLLTSAPPGRRSSL